MAKNKKDMPDFFLTPEMKIRTVAWPSPIGLIHKSSCKVVDVTHMHVLRSSFNLRSKYASTSDDHIHGVLSCIIVFFGTWLGRPSPFARSCNCGFPLNLGVLKLLLILFLAAVVGMDLLDWPSIGGQDTLEEWPLTFR